MEASAVDLEEDDLFDEPIKYPFLSLVKQSDDEEEAEADPNVEEKVPPPPPDGETDADEGQKDEQEVPAGDDQGKAEESQENDEFIERQNTFLQDYVYKAIIETVQTIEENRIIDSMQFEEDGLIGEEASENESGDDQADEDYAPPPPKVKTNQHQTRSSTQKNIKVTKRGRGRPRKSSLPDHSEEEEEENDPLDVSGFHKEEKTAQDLCPPPAPKKMKGGRRTMLKESLPRDLPEGDVQLACAGLYAKAIAKYIHPSEMLVPYKGTMSAPLLRHIHVTEEFFLRFLRMINITSSIGDQNFVNMIMEARKQHPYNLKKLLKSEHTNFVFQCYTSKELLDNTFWLRDLAYQFHTNPRFSHLKPTGRGSVVQEGNIYYVHGQIYHAQFAHLLGEAKRELELELIELARCSLVLAKHLDARIQEIQQLRKQKFFIQEKYEALHYELTTRDPKFDEMSITGVRCIKMMMDEPYFKTEDGLLSFQMPTLGDPDPSRECPLSIDKQKWTSKDLHALKQLIKDCVLSAQLEMINAQYLDLLTESDARRVEEMQKEGKSVDVIYQAPQKRKRGRPTKEETTQRDKYGIVFPVLARSTQLPIISAYQLLPKQLSEWRTAREKRLRNMNFETLMRENGSEALISWNDVALKLMIRAKKLRLESDCWLTYKHEVDPQISSKRLTMEYTKYIQSLHEGGNYNWKEIADKVNEKLKQTAELRHSDDRKEIPLHTPYQCFSKYRAKIAPPSKPVWDETLDECVKEALDEHPAHWRRVAAKVGDEAVTKKAVVERYKKVITPMLKTGPFSRVEDCLLLLTLQSLKDFVSEEGHFGAVLAYLPWRYETTWRDRAHNLFNDWIVPWTIEEDRMLLDLAETMNRNWQQISEQFSSFKNRKGCLTRYKILQRNLGDGRNANLEEYHEAYAMTRYNVFQYRHLQEIVNLLKKVDGAPEASEDLLEEFPLSLNARPSEDALNAMLMCFNRTVLKDCVASLEKYIEGRSTFWTAWSKKNGVKRRTFDRRTFHPQNPQSVASAIHIRGLKLLPKANFKNQLNEFEEEVYKFFGRFNRTKSLKENAKRPYLPPVSFFFKMDSVKGIIDPKTANVDTEEPTSRKWAKIATKTNEKKTSKKSGKRKNDTTDDDDSDCSDDIGSLEYESDYDEDESCTKKKKTKKQDIKTNIKTRKTYNRKKTSKSKAEITDDGGSECSESDYKPPGTKKAKKQDMKKAKTPRTYKKKNSKGKK